MQFLMNGQTFMKKILISAKSETLPDVARLDSAWVPEFEKNGNFSTSEPGDG